MIDIAFSKLAIIGLAALVFIGPERLPKVARMAGKFLGRAQRYINEVKSEVNRDIAFDELRKMQKEVQEAAGDVQQSITENLSQAESELKSAWNDAASADAYVTPLAEPPAADRLAVKAKTFRKKRLARTSAIPSWFKRQNGRKSRAMSCAARVTKYRPAVSDRKPSASFY
ncbi:MAG: Sec-independent protein translocase protein TatB [Noviherbaspirillum sp.]